MARSKHTRPRHVRAADRIRDPRGRRDAAVPARDRAAAWPLPRIVVERPRPGHLHPATRGDVAALLRFVGESACYGVRSVALARGPSRVPGPVLGRLSGPGLVRIFDVPPSPWLLPAVPAEAEARRLETAGARLEPRAVGTAVHWTDEMLRDFVLLDVLLHELGHHVRQHESRKPGARAARTRDHEAFAERFARRWRARWRRAAKGP